MSLPQFKLLRPGTVEEAISLLGECSRHAGEAARAIRIVAGGTGLISSLPQKPLGPHHVLHMPPLPATKRSRATEKGPRIGALPTPTPIQPPYMSRQSYT